MKDTVLRHRLAHWLVLASACVVSSAFLGPTSQIRNGARCSAIQDYTTTILKAAATKELPEGLLKTITKQGNGQALRLGDIATVKYSCYLPDVSSAPPFAQATQQKMVVGEGTMIEGWEKAIRTMQIGERSVVRIVDPALAYGATGVPPLIPPSAAIEMDIEILAAQAATTNIDFDNLAAVADGSTPKTATDIAAAFEARQAARAASGIVKKEGWEGWVEKAQNFYFFGLFEGETGERPPWFLRPSITFPLAFLIVGAAFYVSYVSGAITERGAQSKDELDEIILSWNALGGAAGAGLSTTWLSAAIATALMMAETMNIGM